MRCKEFGTISRTFEQVGHAKIKCPTVNIKYEEWMKIMEKKKENERKEVKQSEVEVFKTFYRHEEPKKGFIEKIVDKFKK